MKFKEVKIQPSCWTLDIIIGRNFNEVASFTAKRYGIESHHFDDVKIQDSVALIESGLDSILKGEKRIVMCLRDIKNHGVLVHELIHVLWYASKNIGFEMNFDSQEWQAVLFEYLYSESIKNNYQIIKSK